MKRSVSAAVALLSVAFTLPVWAQDPAMDSSSGAETLDAGSAPMEVAQEDTATDAGTAEAAPADTSAETAPDTSAEAAPADTGSETSGEATTTEAAPAEAGTEATAEAPAEASTEVGVETTEAAPTEEAAAEEAPAGEEPREPFYLYVGADYANVTLSLSDDAREAAFGGHNPRSDMYRLRVGTRLFGSIGLEAQYGLADTDDDEAGKYEVAAYYGAYLVPTGMLFDVVEISVPVGYSVFKAERGNATTELDGVSYGMNIEVPIAIGVEWLPEIRIGGGGLVYQAHDESRVYGYHAGLRADFKL